MTKGALKPTKRRKGKATKRVVSAIPAYSQVPRTYFHHMPAEFRVALRASQTVGQNVAPGVYAITSQSYTDPDALGFYPEYMPQLMSIYSRAWVEKVTCKFVVQMLTGGQVSLTWAAANMPFVDLAGLAAAQAQAVIRNHPTGKWGTLGSREGGHDITTFTMANDNRVSLGTGLYDNQYATTSTNAQIPILTSPIAPTPDAPYLYLVLGNQVAGACDLLTTREITYHMCFRGLHGSFLM